MQPELHALHWLAAGSCWGPCSQQENSCKACVASMPGETNLHQLHTTSDTRQTTILVFAGSVSSLIISAKTHLDQQHLLKCGRREHKQVFGLTKERALQY